MPNRQTNHSSRVRRRGQSMVEFAVVASVLLLLLLGVFEISQLAFTLNSVTNGVREAGHYVALHPPGLVVDSAYRMTVTQQIAPKLFLVDTNNATNYRLDVDAGPNWGACQPDPNCYYPPITITVGSTVTLALPLPFVGSSVSIIRASTARMER
jgi:Flp pilus assembly protein TadG